MSHLEHLCVANFACLLLNLTCLYRRMSMWLVVLTCVCCQRRGSEDRHGTIKLSRQADSLLQLAAAVHDLNALSASAGAADACRSDLPQNKKLKVRSKCDSRRWTGHAAGCA